VTDSEKLDLLLKEMQGLKQTLVPAVKRLEKQMQLISSMLLSSSEVQKVKKAK